MSRDHWYIPEGVQDEQAKRKARPKSMIHYHGVDDNCNEQCIGVVFNERARTVDGTLIGKRV